MKTAPVPAELHFCLFDLLVHLTMAILKITEVPIFAKKLAIVFPPHLFALLVDGATALTQ